MTPPLHVQDGDSLSELPSVEGYVPHVKSASGTREDVYLTVQNGLLFHAWTCAGEHPPQSHTSPDILMLAEAATGVEASQDMIADFVWGSRTFLEAGVIRMCDHLR